jgi:hypothetical protein
MTTQLLLRFPWNGKSMLVNPNIGAHIRPSYHAVLILQNREKKNNYRCNMIKVTCLIDPRRTIGTPRKFGLEGPRTMVPAQRYLSQANTSNHSIKCNKHVLYECTERKRSDSENFGTRITRFGVVVEKI